MTTITVSTTAGLASALSSAQPGETILLAPGTYSGVDISNVNINGTVTIESQNSADPAVIAGLNVQGSSGLTFSDLTLTTVGVSTQFADYVENSSNIAFSNCLVTGPV